MDEGRRLTRIRRWLSGAEPAPEADDPTRDLEMSPPVGREVEFSAYTEDCRIFAFYQLEAERLSDALNEHESFPLDSVLLLALDDNRALEIRHLEVMREELVAVRASGPRGNAGRRTRTRPSPVAMRAGPYMIRGYLHSPPGGDALQHFRRRGTMVPLTEAWIEYAVAGGPYRARVGPIIVNRTFVDWIDRAKDTEVRVDLPVETRVDPRAKDMTGHVRAPVNVRS